MWTAVACLRNYLENGQRMYLWLERTADEAYWGHVVAAVVAERPQTMLWQELEELHKANGCTASTALRCLQMDQKVVALSGCQQGVP